MIPIEEIEENIKKYGYLVVKPKKISPSYYRLVGEDAIVEALVRLDSLVQNVSDPTGYSIKTTNVSKVYVPRENRNPKAFVPFLPSELEAGITNHDVPAEELSSEFSEYELSNGAIVSIRTIVNQIKKTKFYTQDGEPIYIVIVTPVTKFKPKNSQ